jgi:ABC-type glycerol-3-phosphate transport system permease component
MSWEGDSNVNQPAFLVFLESFAPNYWALQSQGQQQRPLQAFYAFNAFPLNSEITRFRIVYTQPSLITISQIVSAVTVTGVLVTMALIAYKNFTANRKMKRLLKD